MNTSAHVHLIVHKMEQLEMVELADYHDNTALNDFQLACERWATGALFHIYLYKSRDLL